MIGMNIAEKKLDKETLTLVSNVCYWGTDTIHLEVKQGGRFG